jgi:hypothetical protein
LVARSELEERVNGDAGDDDDDDDEVGRSTSDEEDDDDDEDEDSDNSEEVDDEEDNDNKLNVLCSEFVALAEVDGTSTWSTRV